VNEVAEPVGDQEEEPRCERRRERRKEVDAERVVLDDREQAPDMREQDEQWIPRRMRDAQYLGGGDVLGRVPELRGRRDRDEVDTEDGEEHDGRQAVGRAFAGPARDRRVGGGWGHPGVGWQM
jgi:hypothetical protein